MVTFERGDGAFLGRMVAGGTWWLDPWVSYPSPEKKKKLDKKRRNV